MRVGDRHRPARGPQRLVHLDLLGARRVLCPDLRRRAAPHREEWAVALSGQAWVASARLVLQERRRGQVRRPQPKGLQALPISPRLQAAGSEFVMSLSYCLFGANRLLLTLQPQSDGLLPDSSYSQRQAE